MKEIIDNLKKAFIEISELMCNTDPYELSKLTDENNNSGDQVKSLDIISNNILKAYLIQCKEVSIIGSEEEEQFYYTNNTNGKYLVCYDPLDGSSNIDSNITVGTIFAIYNKESGLKDGNSIVCAGYCLYGSSTQFILADNKVDIYLLKKNKFILVKENLKIKEKGNIYSFNESYRNYWLGNQDNAIIDELIKEKYSSRWVGSMVTDCHRTLIKGGLFSYPKNSKSLNGKIRILYEAYPFAYIFKVAGGESFDGENEILNIEFPENIHKKTPVYLGGKYEIDLCKKLFI